MEQSFSDKEQTVRHQFDRFCRLVLHVKHTCIDKVTMLADTSIMIEVHATELKNSKMALGKAPSNLTPNQQAKVEWIAKTDPRLYRAYKLKEALRLVFYNDTVEDAKEALDAWFKWARHCRIPAFVELQKKINRHKQSILNTIEYGLTNARIEAINNKIKLSIRMAYGFRNIDNMMAMIMLRCSDIKVQLPWETDEWSSFFCLG